MLPQDKFSYGPAYRKITNNQVRLPKNIRTALDKGLNLEGAIIKRGVYLGVLEKKLAFVLDTKEHYCESLFSCYKKISDTYSPLPFQFKEFISHENKFYWQCFHLIGYEKGDFQIEQRFLYKIINKPQLKIKKDKLSLNNLEECAFDRQVLFLACLDHFELWDKKVFEKYYALLEHYPPY